MVLCLSMWLDIFMRLLALTVRWAWIHVGYNEHCGKKLCPLCAVKGLMVCEKLDRICWNARVSQLELVLWLWLLKRRLERIAKCWTPNQNPCGKPSGGQNHCPSMIAFSFLIDPTSNVWWMGCLFNANVSQLDVVSWLWFAKSWTPTGLLPHYKPKSIWQTIWRPQPLPFYYCIVFSYRPSKQCLMDGMPIQSPCESVVVAFSHQAMFDGWSQLELVSWL
jgi:hypothetical protein